MFAKRLATTVAFVCISASAAFSAVPPMISYQGKLMQPSGAAVPDGTYSIQFAIYDDPVSADPAHKLWGETNPNVQLKGGLFSVLLGSVNNVPGNIFDDPPRFFGVKIGSDPEMTPRQKIASVAYAQVAEKANTVVDNAVTASKIAAGAVTTEKVAVGAITADRLAPGVATPVGTIVMWSGAVASIPQGWKLCDGTNGTPDLRNRFIVGAGDEYAVAATGGEKLHQLSVAEMPVHHHMERGSFAGPVNAYQVQLINAPYDPGGTLTNNWTADSGGDQPHENRPPYYALCFIMKQGY